MARELDHLKGGHFSRGFINNKISYQKELNNEVKRTGETLFGIQMGNYLVENFYLPESDLNIEIHYFCGIGNQPIITLSEFQIFIGKFNKEKIKSLDTLTDLLDEALLPLEVKTNSILNI